MPNDCFNRITVSCTVGNQYLRELNTFIHTDLRDLQTNTIQYNNNINVECSKTRYITFTLRTNWTPDYEWLQKMVSKYPHCLIKNFWGEEGGAAGVWVGYYENASPVIQQLEWDDLCIEGLD